MFVVTISATKHLLVLPVLPDFRLSIPCVICKIRLTAAECKCQRATLLVLRKQCNPA